MDKIIILIVGEEKTGKTTVINHVWDLLPTFSKKRQLLNHKIQEILGVVDSCSKTRRGIDRPLKIGVSSWGDTPELIQMGIIYLVNENCDITICASHTIEQFLEAIHTLSEYPIDEDMKKKGISEEMLPDIQNKIENYRIVTFSPFTNYIESSKRKAIPSCSKKELYNNSHVEDINISRLSAATIVTLVDNLNAN